MTEAGERILLTACVTAMVTAAVVSATTLGPAARRMPLVVAVPTLVLLLFELRRLAQAARVKTPVAAPATRRLEAETFAWLGALLVVVWLLGMLAGLPLFLVAYLRTRSREPWPVAIGMAACVWAVLFGVLDRALGIQMQGGALQSLLDSRWRP